MLQGQGGGERGMQYCGKLVFGRVKTGRKRNTNLANKNTALPTLP